MSSASATLKVRRGRAVWDVERDGTAYGRFTRLDEAVEHACALARHLAHCGGMATVSVEGDLREVHCFQPSEYAATAVAGATDPDEIDPGITE